MSNRPDIEAELLAKIKTLEEEKVLAIERLKGQIETKNRQIESLTSTVRLLIFCLNRILGRFKNLYNMHKSRFDTGAALSLEVMWQEGNIKKAESVVNEINKSLRDERKEL